MELVPPPVWCDTPAKVEQAMRYFISRGADGVGIDAETTGTTLLDLPITVQFSEGEQCRVAMPAELTHCQAVYDCLQDERIPKVGTFVKRDIHWLTNLGHRVEGPIEDTLVLDHYWDENRFGMHGLKETARDYCGLRMQEFKEVFPKKVPGLKNANTEERIRYVMYGQCPGTIEPGADERFRAGLEYSSKDPYASMRVRRWLRNQLAQERATEGYSLLELFDAVERPFMRSLWNMERRGFMLHSGLLKAKKPEIARIKERIRLEINQMAGWAVNLNSPQQVGKLLFEQLQHPVIEYTDEGAPSTKEAVLAKLAAKGCPVSQKMMEFRGIDKIEGTYIDGYVDKVWSDHRLHCTVNAHVAVTGRLTTSDPSLQNLPRYDEDAWKIREAFVAGPGRRLVVADYDQLEMKLMAHLSQDAGMLRAILEGKDLHCNTAALMAGVSYDEVWEAKRIKEEKGHLTDRHHQLLLLRQGAKTIGFGVLYGAGPMRIAAELKRSMKEAEALIETYFRALPGVKAHILRTHEEARQVGYVRTLLGRRRRLPQIRLTGNDRNSRMLRQEAERQAQNLGPQGGGADLMRLVMPMVEADPTLRACQAQLLMQVHDELVIEVPDVPEIVATTKKRVKEIMENPGIPLTVPLTASGSDGYSWAEAK